MASPSRFTSRTGRRYKCPDLKQADVKLIRANQASLPVWLRVLDGNASEIQYELCRHGSGLADPVRRRGDAAMFVADAALYNEKTLQQLAATCRFVTRVPATLRAVKELYAGRR
ncbi:MAG: hypothetical protein U5L04_05040 [Trueperaceae bacterium]|nr:hypothetical protein [Trueperaceae bacterium]